MKGARLPASLPVSLCVLTELAGGAEDERMRRSEEVC